MIEIELEKTYLIKKLPEGLERFTHKEMVDMYIPAGVDHPVLRIRRKGEKYEITKKQPIHDSDSSEQEEHTIKLSEQEYGSFLSMDSKKVQKFRYDYVYHGIKAEVDVFKGDLDGLVLVDFEFADKSQKESFKMPDFCLVEVTQEKIFAGGMLCGKKYSDIALRLEELGYVRVAK